MQPEQAQNPANEMDAEAVAMAPVNWKDIVRQHVTGPVFSLAFHIFLLVLLGTLVFIAPNAVKDDIDPVQITEMEPVLPPPEEEPMPSDMTVMDTSSPSLDRYESENQQMEEVGVTDVAIMTDIEIPTPLTIPDSNSALKLQGVLPFGRPGGGDMGDGGEGDGRGNTQGMLQGVFYDLKQTRSRQPSTEFAGVPQDSNGNRGLVMERVPPTLKIMQSFVNGSWRRDYDEQGRVHYPALDKYYRATTRLWTSCFYTDTEIEARLAPRFFQCEKEVSPAAWVCIYSGNVVAPFSGKFRFLGTADDVILVRFNNQVVLDYGFGSYTARSFFFTDRDRNGNPVTNRLPDGMNELRQLQESSSNSIRSRSPLYSKQPLDVYPVSGAGDTNPAHNLAKGSVITVQEGEIYPIEVLISEIPGGSYFQALFMEQLDADGKPLDSNPQEFVLFRTTLALPVPMAEIEPEVNASQPEVGGGNMPPGMPVGMGMPGGMPGMPGGMPGGMQRQKFKLPKFKPYGPIWRVVRSTASSGGGSGGSGGSLNGGLIGNRTTPRTARVNEDDEDISL